MDLEIKLEITKKPSNKAKSDQGRSKNNIRIDQNGFLLSPEHYKEAIDFLLSLEYKLSSNQH